MHDSGLCLCVCNLTRLCVGYVLAYLIRTRTTSTQAGPRLKKTKIENQNKPISLLLPPVLTHHIGVTARSVEDETRNAELNIIEILNGGEILVNCKFKSNKNLNLNLYCKIPRNSNPIKTSIRLCTVRYQEI